MSAWERHKTKQCPPDCHYCLHKAAQLQWAVWNLPNFTGVNRAMRKDLKARQNDQNKIVRVRKV
jgi:hypothetical protein